MNFLRLEYAWINGGHREVGEWATMVGTCETGDRGRCAEDRFSGCFLDKWASFVGQLLPHGKCAENNTRRTIQWAHARKSFRLKAGDGSRIVPVDPRITFTITWLLDKRTRRSRSVVVLMNKRNRSPDWRYAKKHTLAWEGGKMLIKFWEKKKKRSYSMLGPRPRRIRKTAYTWTRSGSLASGLELSVSTRCPTKSLPLSDRPQQPKNYLN